MRLFIGIPFSEATRRQIRNGVAAIRPQLFKGKLSDWSGYHLTLKFLGDASEERLAELMAAMDETRFSTEPFKLVFTGLGCFKKRGGDVLWLGVESSPMLDCLQNEVELLSERAGFVRDSRAYSPHLTLGRGVRYETGFEWMAAQWRVGPLSEEVDRVVVFHSTQREGKLTYEPLLSKVLKEAR